ncbi:MAG: hypothetical protein ACRD4F_05285 [Candidatus Angelobacter sp.]
MIHDPTAAYTFDGANRLTTVNTTGASYTYFGPLRIKKTIGGATTIYIYSGSKVIAEYASGAALASPAKEYVYSATPLCLRHSGNKCSTTYSGLSRKTRVGPE